MDSIREKERTRIKYPGSFLLGVDKKRRELLQIWRTNVRKFEGEGEKK